MWRLWDRTVKYHSHGRGKYQVQDPDHWPESATPCYRWPETTIARTKEETEASLRPIAVSPQSYSNLSATAGDVQRAPHGSCSILQTINKHTWLGEYSTWTNQREHCMSQSLGLYVAHCSSPPISLSPYIPLYLCRMYYVPCTIPPHCWYLPTAVLV